MCLLACTTWVYQIMKGKCQRKCVMIVIFPTTLWVYLFGFKNRKSINDSILSTSSLFESHLFDMPCFPPLPLYLYAHVYLTGGKCTFLCIDFTFKQLRWWYGFSRSVWERFLNHVWCLLYIWLSILYLHDYLLDSFRKAVIDWLNHEREMSLEKCSRSIFSISFVVKVVYLCLGTSAE